VKLNTDGSVRGNPGMAAAGGLLRDEQGRWLSGFMVNIGQSTNTVAELWGLLSGLLGIWVFGV